jgi:pimeloyl-ACP methyl ester carboxylesterase
MREGIEKRELISLECSGTHLQGTYHRPFDHLSQTPFGQPRQARPGILFFNSLSLPRAASGDSAVHWADSIAAQGYPTFRIDLPGLGDSGGHSSTDLLDFINGGGYTQVAAQAIRELVERFRLSGLVIVGHCAGSVSAIYGAASSKECKGLILLDPYFHLPQAKRPRVREELSGWVRRNKFGKLLSHIYDYAKELFLQVRGSSLPGNANSQLLACWKQLTTAGMPTLMLQAPGIKAQGAKPRVGEFDYVQYVMRIAGRKSQVTAEFVEGADHSFANYDGRTAVQQHIEHWLVSNFPLDDFKRAKKSVAPLRAGDAQGNQRKSTPTPSDLGCVLEGR